MKDSDIKALVPSHCPHCGKDIVIEFLATVPSLIGIHTPESIDAAKEDAISRINALTLPEEASKPVLDWIKNPETVFGPNDIDEILKQFIKPNNESKEE